MKVTHYYAKSVYEDGSSFAKYYPFTEGHANAIGSILNRDGIPYKSALRLIEGWNREAARHKPRRYYYSLTVEDKLRILD